MREQAVQKRQHGRSQAVCSGLQRNGPDNLSVHIHQQAVSLPVCDTHGRTIVFVPAQTVLRRSAAATGGAQAGAFHLAVPQHLLQQRAHRRDAYARCCSKLRAGSTLCNAELLACFSRPGLAWEFSTSGTSFVILFYKFVIKV